MTRHFYQAPDDQSLHDRAMAISSKRNAHGRGATQIGDVAQIEHPLIDCDLSKFDFRGKDFSNQIIVGTCLKGADMRGCNLDNTVLYNADLSEADLTGASLVGAQLISANVSKAYFVNADLTDADFTGAVIIGSDFRSARFCSTCFTGARCVAARFEGSDFSLIEFAGAELIDICFEGARWGDIPLQALPQTFSVNGERFTIVNGQIVSRHPNFSWQDDDLSPSRPASSKQQRCTHVSSRLSAAFSTVNGAQ